MTFTCDDEYKRISELSAENGHTLSVRAPGNPYDESTIDLNKDETSMANPYHDNIMVVTSGGHNRRKSTDCLSRRRSENSVTFRQETDGSNQLGKSSSRQTTRNEPDTLHKRSLTASSATNAKKDSEMAIL
jgi:hypothetical protein